MVERLCSCQMPWIEGEFRRWASLPPDGSSKPITDRVVTCFLLSQRGKLCSAALSHAALQKKCADLPVRLENASVKKQILRQN